MTSVLENATVIGAIRAGAIGYLLKTTAADALCQAIRAAAAGQVQLAPEAAALLMREVRHPEATAVSAGPDALTDRETDVLRLVAQGQANKEIAVSLGIGEKTVKTHVSNVLAKLGVQSRTQAALHAARIGLVDVERCRSAVTAPGTASRTPTTGANDQLVEQRSSDRIALGQSARYGLPLPHRARSANGLRQRWGERSDRVFAGDDPCPTRVAISASACGRSRGCSVAVMRAAPVAGVSSNAPTGSARPVAQRSGSGTRAGASHRPTARAWRSKDS